MFPGEEVIEHNLESCGGAELLAWVWGSQKVGFALVQGPDCESSPSTVRGWEHLFSKAMMYHLLWGRNKVKMHLQHL